ncbi:MAG: hypothetical protein EXS39_04150 [Opitutaceae bacterium]|nr:hypothetical protein [Opitutaceae bacterium]
MEKPWKVILTFVGIFMAGTITGGMIALRVARQLQITAIRAAMGSMNPGMNNPGVNSAGRGADPGSGPNANLNVAIDQFVPMQMRRFNRELNLTEEQRQKIKPVLQRSREDLIRLHREGQEVMKRVEDEVSRMLTPEQTARLAEIRSRQQQQQEQQQQQRQQQRQLQERQQQERQQLERQHRKQ